MKLLRSTKLLASTLALVLLAQAFVPAIALTLPADALQGRQVVIPDGTEFTVETTEEISSKTAAEGDPLTFKVAEDVKIDGQTVIAKDTLVKGVVAAAKKAGMMGRGGSLGIRVEST